MKQAIRKNIKETHNIEPEKSIYTLIIDMNNVMKISISADKHVGLNGLEYGLIFQSLIQIKKMLSYKNFDYVYAFYDGYQSGILRYELYHPYKANRDKNYTNNEYEAQMKAFCQKVINYSKAKRKSLKTEENDENESFLRQRDILFRILEELFVRQVICDNVEGDDLIAYYVCNKKENEKIVIYSGDRDLTQLISEDVTVYVPTLKKFITPSNHTQLIGYYYKNVLLKKILCGDTSDNIKGIKGLGENTLFKIFPEFLNEEVFLDNVIDKSRQINEDRKKNKQKPLKVLDNIINHVTDGEQGDKIYEINEKIISLKKPLLTQEAIEEMNNIMYAPIDPEGREYKNVYKIINEEKMTELMDENKFASFFASFNPLIETEKKRFKLFS